MAERYFVDDAAGALIKLRQLAEFMAKDIAAQHALLPKVEASFDDTLRTLRARNVLPREVADILYHLKRVGNAAAHEDTGPTGDDLNALKMARGAAIWFHQTYNGAPGYKAGPFVPPMPPIDASEALRKEIEALREAVRASSDSAAKALLQAQEADAARLATVAKAAEREEERLFWENYAAETEASRKEAEKALVAVQAEAKASPPAQLELLAQTATVQAAKIELDEAATRVLIDDQLRAAGWIVDNAVLKHSAGTRPQEGKAIAIAEWPTASGPVDYALFLNDRCVGVIEAKRELKDVPGRLRQAKRYARDIVLTADELPPEGPWQHGKEAFRVPFLFVTNGRPYVKQLATKSGIWFWDARPGSGDGRVPRGGVARR